MKQFGASKGVRLCEVIILEAGRHSDVGDMRACMAAQLLIYMYAY